MSEHASIEAARLDACSLLDAYRRRSLSPVEVTRAMLERIESLDPQINAFCLVDADTALESARASEQRWLRGEPCGIVDGVPATVKDVILTRGWPTLRGSRTVEANQPWEHDAPAVARLREQGAVLLGKTTTPEFGWKGVTDSPLTGITRNPWDPGTTPGGSSGGAAAAAALGLGALHLGTDGGGSVRIPASFTGIFGHKPSFGRVPAWPLSPFGTLAHIGPMTRTVSDAALLLTVISEPDSRDWHALPFEARDYRLGLERGVAGLRIGFSANLGFIEVEPEVEQCVREAVAVFASLGAQVEEVDPGVGNTGDTFQVFWFSAATYLGRMLDPAKRDLLDPGLAEVMEEGARYSLTDYYDATAARGVVGQRMKAFHDDYDLLLTPAMPIPAFEAGREAPASHHDGERWSDWTPFTYPFNLTGQPACSVPCGFTAAGLPVGLQIVGPMHDDIGVLRAARAYEAVRPFRMPTG